MNIEQLNEAIQRDESRDFQSEVAQRATMVGLVRDAGFGSLKVASVLTDMGLLGDNGDAVRGILNGGLLERTFDTEADRFLEQEFSKLAYKEQIPGGKATGRSPSDFPKEQLRKGVKVELEHTPDRKRAREIAMDHLVERKDYYDLLPGVEKEDPPKEREEAVEKMEEEVEGEEKGGKVTPAARRAALSLLARYAGKPIPDEKVHDVAEKHKVDPSKLESYIYSLASKHVSLGHEKKSMCGMSHAKPRKLIKVKGKTKKGDARIQLVKVSGAASSAFGWLAKLFSVAKGEPGMLRNQVLRVGKLTSGAEGAKVIQMSRAAQQAGAPRTVLLADAERAGLKLTPSGELHASYKDVLGKKATKPTAAMTPEPKPGEGWFHARKTKGVSGASTAPTPKAPTTTPAANVQQQVSALAASAPKKGDTQGWMAWARNSLFKAPEDVQKAFMKQHGGKIEKLTGPRMGPAPTPSGVPYRGVSKAPVPGKPPQPTVVGQSQHGEPLAGTRFKIPKDWESLKGTVKQYPLESAGVAAGTGLLAGWATD